MIRSSFARILTVWSAAAALFSCGESEVDVPLPPPDKPYLTLQSELPPFDSAGGSAELVFSSNEAWSITAEPPADKGDNPVGGDNPGDGDNPGGGVESDRATGPEGTAADDWFGVAPASGDAGENIAVTVSVRPNEAYAGRAVTLVIGTASLEKRIDVTQLRKNVILLGGNREEIDDREQTLAVEVRSNVVYEVEIREGGEWIDELPASRAGELKEQTHTFRIARNTAEEPRTGIIVFKDADSELADELTVVQAAWVDPDPERSALNALYESAGGGGWTRSENWCSDKPLGAWYGVETDDEGHVTALRLPRNNLAGTIPEKIGKLTHLRHLDLSWNGLEGELTYKNMVTYEIESYLDDLLELETIDLSHNRLTSRFMPGAWYRMEGLRTVDLSCNRLEGFAFPLLWEKMFENGRYVDLILNDNYLWDTTPEVIQNHPKWSRLALQVIRQYYSDGDHGMGGPGIEYDVPVYLPDFTFTDLRDGTQQSIRDVYSANELTMLFHWDPMQEESETFMTTVVRRFHTLFSGQGFAVVAILPEGEEYRRAAESYLAGHEVPWPVVSEYADAEGHRTVLPSSPYPSYQLVDRSGMVTVDMFSGALSPNHASPESFLVDFMAHPLQNIDYLNEICKKIFGNSEYQSTDFTMDKKFETLQTATKGKGIDLVLIGDAFADIDIETGYYGQVMDYAIEACFALEPLKSYREYFNVYMVYAVSRDTHIGFYYQSGKTALGVLLETDTWFDVYTARFRLPDYCDVPFAGRNKNIACAGVVVNASNGGVAYLQSPVIGPTYGFAGYNCNRSFFKGTFMHEVAGHAFGLLGDEYVKYSGTRPSEITENDKSVLNNCQDRGWYLNVSLTDDPQAVYWRHLIGHPHYPYVGIHEGGYYYPRGVWRSEEKSVMNDSYNDFYFNAISRELIVKRIMEFAGEEYTFEKFMAKDSDEGRPGAGRAARHSSRGMREESYRHQPPIIGD